MSDKYHALVEGMKAGIKDLQGSVPDLMKGFGHLGRAAYTDGVLSRKQKEMMSLSIAIASRCEGCIAWHTEAAMKAGMTRPELAELVGVAVHMGGGPSLTHGIEALEAFDSFARDGQ